MRALLALALLLAACADPASDVSPADPNVSTAGDYQDPVAAEAEAATNDLSEADAVAEVGPPEGQGASDQPLASDDLTAADIEGDWVYCDGPTVLDESVSFTDDNVRTYLHDRPAMFATFDVRDGQIDLDDGRSYRAERSGETLSLAGADGRSVYARSEADCP